MSEEPPAKRVRKGTRSCVECRQRKVRCIWPDDTDACQGCLARGGRCERQELMVATSETVKSTSRSRIENLEKTVSGLCRTVQDLEARLGLTSHRRPSVHPLSHQEHAHDQDFASDSSDLSPAEPPSHLLHLFQNDTFGSHESGNATPSSRHVPTTHKSQGCAALRKLMPSRDDMLIITAQASSWLSLYNAIFPMASVTKTSEEMLLQYDILQDPKSDVTAIAALLLTVAITVQQAPKDAVLQTITDTVSFVNKVSSNVDRFVVSDDIVAGTLEGIETTLLYLRLQLGRATVKKLWLLSRRIIALAELIGLPRAQQNLTRSVQTELNSSEDLLKRKANVWESICALDRIMSMMWSLPLATSGYPLAQRPLTDAEGQIIPQAYLYGLAEIGGRILDLDHMHSSGQSATEIFNAVVVTDQELRQLASNAPHTWWKTEFEVLSVEAILQYWQQYLTIRTHLKLALTYYEDQQFAFNFITCFNSCQELANRYLALRAILPIGFFANRLVDLQAFTAAVFLLIASHRNPKHGNISSQGLNFTGAAELMERMVKMMESVAGQAGGEFAQQAANAVRSLSSLLAETQTTKSQKLTLSLPLIGKINVARKANASNKAPKTTNTSSGRSTRGRAPENANVGPIPTPQESPFTSSDLDFIDSLSFSIPEDYSFLTDEAFANEQWLTWTGQE